MGSTQIRNSASLSLRSGERVGERGVLAILLLLLSTTAIAHPTGFHKKLTVTLTKKTVSALVVMDVDSGDRCLLLREAVDSNRDGLITGEEVTKLKERLTKLATTPLKLSISGAPIPLTVKDTKISLRDDKRANDAPLSVALLIEIEHPHEVSPGMHFEVEDVAPDQSTIVLQVFQEGSKSNPFEAEIPSGVKTRIRFE